MPDKTIINTGLRGVTIASTKISDVDGAIGRLVYRGYLAKDLAEKVTFEEVIHLLLYEKLPNRNELANLKKNIHNHSHLPDSIIAAMKTFPKDSLPMDVLQSVIPMLAHHDPFVKKTITRDMALEIGINLIAKMSSIVAAWERIRKGLAPVMAAPEMSHAANFIYMMKGKKPDKDIAHFMDTALVLHAEHSFNASTFAAREVASTRAHMYAAITAAIGSLSGELHGGANTRVMEMLKKIGSLDNVDGYVENELKAGRKVMGLGHAVYKVDDPRALVLAPMSKKMGEKSGETKWYEISAKLEKCAKDAFLKEKNMEIFVNVDYYSASLYYSMGIPMDFFTPVFAISRISGWVAHVIEEQFAEAAPQPVLYRPESEYVGEYCGPNVCTYEEIDER
ncbi:MAG: citrate (Si)-synthase [Proteobacteria bacterium]|nr:citrate (Si)-synthase [Pseudomonadota bacterium]